MNLKKTSIHESLKDFVAAFLKKIKIEEMTNVSKATLYRAIRKRKKDIV